MNAIEYFKAPRSRQIPVSELERLAHDGRRVIPSRNAKYLTPDEITGAKGVELMERYFQIKPTVTRPKVSVPGGAIAVVAISVLLFLIDFAALRANFFVILIALGGIAGGLFWIYRVYEPVRSYLYEFENYMMRETLSYDAFIGWQAKIRRQMDETTASRLGLDVEAMTRSVMSGGASVGGSILIEGYESSATPVESYTPEYIFYFSPTRRAPPLVEFFRKLFGAGNQLKNMTLNGVGQRSQFQLADHVEYRDGETPAGRQTGRHWRAVGYLYFLPLADTLAVYKTRVDARDLRSRGDTTSEYFYQSVLGIQTTVQDDLTEFKLLIGHGLSPSLYTTQSLDILGNTVKSLREQIKLKKALGLRRDVEGNVNVDVPEDIPSDLSTADAPREAPEGPAPESHMGDMAPGESGVGVPVGYTSTSAPSERPID